MLSTVIMRFAPLRIGPLRFLEITQKVVVRPKTTVKPWCIAAVSSDKNSNIHSAHRTTTTFNAEFANADPGIVEVHFLPVF